MGTSCPTPRPISGIPGRAARTPRQVASWLGASSDAASGSLRRLTAAVERARYAPSTSAHGKELVDELTAVQDRAARATHTTRAHARPLLAAVARLVCGAADRPLGCPGRPALAVTDRPAPPCTPGGACRQDRAARGTGGARLSAGSGAGGEANCAVLVGTPALWSSAGACCGAQFSSKRRRMRSSMRERRLPDRDGLCAAAAVGVDPPDRRWAQRLHTVPGRRDQQDEADDAEDHEIGEQADEHEAETGEHAHGAQHSRTSEAMVPRAGGAHRRGELRILGVVRACSIWSSRRCSCSESGTMPSFTHRTVGRGVSRMLVVARGLTSTDSPKSPNRVAVHVKHTSRFAGRKVCVWVTARRRSSRAVASPPTGVTDRRPGRAGARPRVSPPATRAGSRSRSSRYRNRRPAASSTPSVALDGGRPLSRCRLGNRADRRSSVARPRRRPRAGSRT